MVILPIQCCLVVYTIDRHYACVWILSPEIQGKASIIWNERGMTITLIIDASLDSLLRVLAKSHVSSCLSGAGPTHRGQPGCSGERGDWLWKDHSGHTVHPGRLHWEGHGLPLQGCVHPAPQNQRYLCKLQVWIFTVCQSADQNCNILNVQKLFTEAVEALVLLWLCNCNCRVVKVTDGLKSDWPTEL